jgi:hypothetical protein
MHYEIYIAKSKKRKIFVAVYEYDHFANDFIAVGTLEENKFYKQNIRVNGIVRDFYEILKEGSETVIDRIILTGIMPIMLDDQTSGFNVATNLSLDPRYNEILRFTQPEVFAYEQKLPAGCRTLLHANKNSLRAAGCLCMRTTTSCRLQDVFAHEQRPPAGCRTFLHANKNSLQVAGRFCT